MCFSGESNCCLINPEARLVSKNRLTRIEERLREELAKILLMESSDPRLKGLTITEVKVDRELAFAEIYVSTIEGTPRSKEVISALEHAHGFLRSELAHRMELRVFPKLRFHWDPTFEQADKIEKLISTIHQENAEKHNTLINTRLGKDNESKS
jgi:ribosome-binding factor A